MTIIKCRECGQSVSDSARTCPSCGITLGRSRIVTYGGGFIGLVLLLGVVAVLAAVFGDKTPEQIEKDRKAAAGAIVNFDLPLQTTDGTLVCPLDAAFDRREGHGFKAALHSRISTFSRLEEARKAGCDEWREGIPVQLSPEAIVNAKEFQAQHRCGMVSHEGGYIFMCQLGNRMFGTVESSAQAPPPAPPAPSSQALSPQTPSAPPALHLQWGTPATLTGTLRWDEFDNCCTNGESHRSRYLALELDEPVVMDADERYDPAPTSVRLVQVAADNFQPTLQEPAHVELSCERMDSGDTGHYAQPVYCAGPSLSRKRQ